MRLPGWRSVGHLISFLELRKRDGGVNSVNTGQTAILERPCPVVKEGKGSPSAMEKTSETAPQPRWIVRGLGGEFPRIPFDSPADGQGDFGDHLGGALLTDHLRGRLARPGKDRWTVDRVMSV